MASYIAPELRDKFESLPINLKDCILERNVQLKNIHDLIRVLEDIVAEGEAPFPRAEQEMRIRSDFAFASP